MGLERSGLVDQAGDLLDMRGSLEVQAGVAALKGVCYRTVLTVVTPAGRVSQRYGGRPGGPAIQGQLDLLARLSARKSKPITVSSPMTHAS